MTIPPDTVAAGQTGHLTAHAGISDVLTAHQEQLGGLPLMAWGAVSLASGTVTVSLGSVTASSVILVSRLGPSGTLGNLSVPTISPGASFTITSTSVSENSRVGYLVIG